MAASSVPTGQGAWTLRQQQSWGDAIVVFDFGLDFQHELPLAYDSHFGLPGGCCNIFSCKNIEDVSIELHTLNRVNQCGVVALATWLITTLRYFVFSPNSQFYGPLTFTLFIVWYFKQWCLSNFKLTWKNAGLTQRQQREMSNSIKGESVVFLRGMES